MVSSMDPLMGVVAFSSNMLREVLHIILYPIVYRRCRIACIAMGGATTMDTGLPVVALYGGRDAVVAALVQGGLITLLAPILLTIILS